MLNALFLTFLIAAQPASFLERTAVALEGSRGDALDFQPLAEEVARRVCAGGKLLAGGNPSLISEFSGRAGGLMLTGALGETVGANDAVMYFADTEHPLPQGLAGSGAFVVLFGAKATDDRIHGVPPRAEEFGLSPTLTMAIQGWLFNAELVAACTRLQKMPVIFESIGMPGGMPRITQYQAKGILFHEKCEVPPIAPGDLSGEYITRVAAMLRRCQREHRADFDRAAMWARQSIANGGEPTMYSMGHIFPDEIAKTAIGKDFRSAQWEAGISFVTVPNEVYHRGQVLIYVGYQHPPTSMLSKAKEAGARAVYISVLKDRDYPTGAGVVWIDPMWPFCDACVPIEGYDIQAFPASGVVDAAIAWEIDRLSQPDVR